MQAYHSLQVGWNLSKRKMGGGMHPIHIQTNYNKLPS